MENVPSYESKHGSYMLIRDLKEAYERLELERWVYGKVQPLIQGEKETIKDAVFMTDYIEFLKYRNGEYTKTAP